MERQEELTYLIRLLDDDSETVRKAVKSKLAAYGRDLSSQLEQLDCPLTYEQQLLIAELMADAKRDWFRDTWPTWRIEPRPERRLETALCLLSDFLEKRASESGNVSRKLDALATEFLHSDHEQSPFGLVSFLFGDDRFEGNIGDYYAPENSNLEWVLEHSKGNPISLACVFHLVGKRLGFPTGGCNYPGHFLGRIRDGVNTILVDCFNGGRLINSKELVQHHPFGSQEIEEIIESEANPEEIVFRMMRNLQNAFKRMKAHEDEQLIKALIGNDVPEN